MEDLLLLDDVDIIEDDTQLDENVLDEMTNNGGEGNE